MKERIKVFMRVIGTVPIEVETENREDAAEVASDSIADGKLRFLQMDVDDLESYFPVAYENPDDGDTVDIIVPDDIREKDIENAVSGIQIWALSELTTDENGRVGDPKVSIFFSANKAFREMERRYEAEKVAFESGYGDIDMFMPPKEGEDGCYVSARMGPCVTWSITRAKIGQGD